MLHLIRFSAQYIFVCHQVQLTNEWYSRISDILIETLELSNWIRLAVHLIQHPLSEQSLSMLKRRERLLSYATNNTGGTTVSIAILPPKRRAGNRIAHP